MEKRNQKRKTERKTENGKTVAYRDMLFRIGITTGEKRIFEAVCRTLGFTSADDLVEAARRRGLAKLETDGL